YCVIPYRSCYLHRLFFYCFGDPRDLHSFPTRRSSDLFLVLATRTQADVLAVWRRDALIRVGVLVCLVALVVAIGAFLVKQLLQRSEEHTSELQSHLNLVCRLLLEKKKNNYLVDVSLWS